MVTFGMVTGVGFSTLQYVDLNSPRNIYIVGLSVFFGLSLPVWMTGNPDAINTGSDVADQILSVLFGTNMFVGALVAFVLDNTIPGTLEERGIVAWRSDSTNGEEKTRSTVYDLPFIQKCLNGISVFRYFPICPSFSRSAKGQSKAKMEQNHAFTDTEISVQYPAEYPAEDATRL